MTLTPLRNALATAWRWLDDTRRALLNLLLLALLLALLGSLVFGGPPRLKDKTVLVLDWSAPVVEQFSGGVRDQLLKQAQGEATDELRLRDLLAVLDAAAKDDKIGSSLLLLDDFAGAGLPTLRELSAALQRFKASGKKLVAWGAQYDQRAYHLAAQADELLLHPMGMVYLEGYARYRTYYKDALDRLGVQAHVVRAGSFKNFAEVYNHNGPSPQTLEAEGLVFNELWQRYTQAVESARKLPAGSLAKLIEELPQRLAAVGHDPAKLALQAKLVDGLKTRDELRRMLIERGAADEEHKTFVQVRYADYLARLKPPADGDAVIGVVVAEGGIVDGDAPAGQVGGRSTAELIRKARDDKSVKALVLRVRSPGGSAYGSELVRRELELTRAAGKPVVVSMGDVAASGGYWISLAADEVVAEPTTVTGSIGVVAMLPVAKGAMDKLGLHKEGFGTTWLAGAYDPLRGLDPRYAELLQGVIGHVYTDFTTKAAAARKQPRETLDALAQGRVWTGAQAKERGLVDRLGSLGDALVAAAQRAKLPADAPVRYLEKQPGKAERLMAWLGVPLAQALAPVPGARAPATPQQWLAPLARSAAADLAPLLAPARAGLAPQPLAHCLCSAP
jgi:protease-4